jgi:ligand-binding sensor domain-containing protein
MYKLLFVFFLFFIRNLNAQISPEQYYITDDEKTLFKGNSNLPASNSILDIITIGDTVWLGTSRGVSVSFDRGESWDNFYGTSVFGTDNTSAIGYDNGTFWAATAKSVEGVAGESVSAGTGLKYTTDNGLTWTAVPQPIDDPDSKTVQYGINTLQALPVTVEEQNITFDIAFTPGTVWITSFAGGTRKSTDKGETWQRVVLPPDYLNSISPNDTLDFCLSPVGGDFCTEGNLNHRAFSIIAINDATLYVGTADGINKSTDNGISWVKFNHQNQNEPISGNFITALGYNGITGTLWAATWKAEEASEYYGVSSSDNGGASWKTFLQNERTHNFGFKNSDVIAATDNGAFRSINQGSSWILPTAVIDTITDPTTKIFLHTDIYYCASTEQNDVWLGSNDGLLKLVESSLWRGQAKIYFAAQPLKDNSTTYCYPNPFSPKQEQLKILYSTDNKPVEVTIRIYDFGMNYVRTVIQNITRQTSIEGPPEFWDGTDDKGNIVPNGVYFYRVDVDSDDPLFGKIIVMQ